MVLGNFSFVTRNGTVKLESLFHLEAQISAQRNQGRVRVSYWLLVYLGLSLLLKVLSSPSLQWLETIQAEILVSFFSI